MEKEFIPYEQALGLKELGFNEKCIASYMYNADKLLWELNNYPSTNKYTHIVSAPTFSQVFRWFREKYNLFCEIQIDRTTEPKFCFNIFQYEHFGNYDEIKIEEWYLYKTQEESELECLKNLIKKITCNYKQWLV